MNVLITLGSGLTFSYSMIVVLFAAISPKYLGYHHCKAPPSSYFEAPCVLITFLLLGKQIEHWAKRKTSESIRELLALRPASAHLLMMDENGKETTMDIPVDLLQIGDRLQ